MSSEERRSAARYDEPRPTEPRAQPAAGDADPGYPGDDPAGPAEVETGMGRMTDERDGGREEPGGTAARAEAGVGTGMRGSTVEERPARLVPEQRAEAYRSQWNRVQGQFVDEPRRAVGQADELVGEMLDELARMFRDQRQDLERHWDAEQASTEDLRQALQRYRSFFERLLSF